MGSDFNSKNLSEIETPLHSDFGGISTFGIQQCTVHILKLWGLVLRICYRIKPWKLQKSRFLFFGFKTLTVVCVWQNIPNFWDLYFGKQFRIWDWNLILSEYWINRSYYFRRLDFRHSLHSKFLKFKLHSMDFRHSRTILFPNSSDIRHNFFRNPTLGLVFST